MNPEQQFNAAVSAAPNDGVVVALCSQYIALLATMNLAGVLAGTFIP